MTGFVNSHIFKHDPMYATQNPRECAKCDRRWIFSLLSNDLYAARSAVKENSSSACERILATVLSYSCTTLDTRHTGTSPARQTSSRLSRRRCREWLQLILAKMVFTNLEDWQFSEVYVVLCQLLHYISLISLKKKWLLNG